jgi:tRNA pseudouridine38-40 synthase
MRVFSIKKVTGGFNSKWACDGRTYAYILPTFAFVPVDQKTTVDYRIPPDVYEEVNNVLALYKGTRNYHNFTSRRPPQDPSCKRYITEVKAGPPFLVKDMEFVKITIKGKLKLLKKYY